MYWVEVEMSNGKTIRREADNINYTYAVRNKYLETYNRKYKTGSYAVCIKTGNDHGITGGWNLLEGIAI